MQIISKFILIFFNKKVEFQFYYYLNSLQVLAISVKANIELIGNVDCTCE
jgi:hypothetical protein